MKDLFCTFEQSKKLKELGFKERCFGAYKILEDEYIFSSKEGDLILGLDVDKNHSFVIKAPLKSQAFIFIREKYGLDINFIFCIPTSYTPTIHFTSEEGLKYKSNKMLMFFNRRIFESKEQAENECINYLIKLINEKV